MQSGPRVKPFLQVGLFHAPEQTVSFAAEALPGFSAEKPPWPEGHEWWVRVRVTVLLQMEDAKAHRVTLHWQDPQGRLLDEVFRDLKAKARGAEGFLIAQELGLRVTSPMEGVFKLLVHVDRQTVGYIPLMMAAHVPLAGEFRPVAPRRTRLPKLTPRDEPST